MTGPFAGSRPARHEAGAVTAAVVDQEPLTRSALAELLSGRGISVVGTAGTTGDARPILERARPRVVIVDPALPDQGGAEAIVALLGAAPGARLLVVTSDQDVNVLGFVVAGACGLVLKTDPPEAIVVAVHAIAAGHSVLSPHATGRLLERIRGWETSVTASGGDPAEAIRARLTARELEIFARLARGESNRAIGEALALSPHTISNHVASILSKLKLENRIQAAVQAVRSGLSE